MSDSLQKNNGNSIQNNQSGFQFIHDNSSNSGNDENGGFSPEKIISLLQRYKWLILVFIISGATGAWFYADSLTPIYESQGTLLISSDESPQDDLSRIITQTTGHGTASTLENELQVLQSRKFSRQVADKIMNGDSTDATKFPALWIQNKDGKVYRARKEVVASRIKKSLSFSLAQEESDVVEVSFRSPSPDEAVKVVNEALEVYVKRSTRQNRQAAASTAEFLKEEKSKIKEKLEASEGKLRRYMDTSGIVQVNEQASDLVNKRANIESELQGVNLELETTQQAISNYESRLDKIKPGLSDQFSQAVGPRIQKLQQDLAEYEGERMQIIAKNPNVLEKEVVPPRLKFIQKQIGRLKNEIKNLSEQLFTEDNEFIGINGRDRARVVSDIQNNLLDLQITKKQLQARKSALEKRKKQIDANFNTLPEGMMQLAKLKRDVRINEELYMNVSKKYADMSIWKESQFGFGRIIDQGDKPEVPVSPNKKIFVLLGLMLGGLVSAGFIAIREFQDDSVRSVNDLRAEFPSLMFTAIPKFDKIETKDREYFSVGKGKIPDEMVLLQDRTNIASESIRRLKNNIIYQNGVAPPKTIAVTSPEKGDGKSTIVANLGVAFAEEGYKTLLVGSDFRRPQLQNYFGITTQDGLYDYLNGSLSFQESLMLIQNSEIKQLKIIVAGKKTQDPEVIGNSKTFNQFLKKMKEVFDVIILDTPPFGIVSDSAPLLKDAESTLVVVRHHKTNSEMLFRTVEELGRIQANVRGIILNDFNHKKEPYNGGYYQKMYGNYDVYVE